MDQTNRSIAQVNDTHIPSGSLLTVTIGRNVGETPLTGSDWADFQSMVHGYLRTFAGAVFGPFTGEGVWEGITEESACITALVNYPANPDNVAAELGRIAHLFDQDAIGWSYGPAKLAGRVGSVRPVKRELATV